jgi:hypothetical protein
MVNYLNILLVFLSLFLTGCFRLIPTRYFDKYTKITFQNNKYSKLRFKGCYIARDSIYDEIYSDRFPGVKFYKFYFFYSNNLFASTRIPTRLNTGEWILTKEDLIEAFITNKINPTKDFNWSYYREADSNVVVYNLQYGVEQYILDFAKIREEKLIVYPDKLIRKNYTAWVKGQYNKEIFYSSFNYEFSDFQFKPDSSKSDFLKRYKRYVERGYRRYDTTTIFSKR